MKRSSAHLPRPSREWSVACTWAEDARQAETNFMSAKTFVDSNILIYAHDLDEKNKQPIARQRLIELLKTRSIVLSPQVLQEFYVNVTRKIAKPLIRRAAREIVQDFSVWCVETSAADMAAAFRIEEEAKISFWDALICASALKSGASVILSEDLNAGQKITGIKIENPFL
jgi:predicted nucleic acid-binding protein